MGSELVRFGVAIEEELLREFDAQIDRKGYGNRSEAIRDLIRAGLVEEAVSRGGDVSGALMLVYKHHVRELSERLTEVQHDLGEAVIAALHVHLDHDHCLEVIVMRGAAQRLKDAADRILALKGVVHGRLSLTSVGERAHRLVAGEPHRHPTPARPKKKAARRA